jgi:hypothetical protein
MADERVHKKTLGKGLPWVDIRFVVPPLDQTLTHSTFLDGTSPVIDVAFIQALVRQFQQCDYLEIGSWRGESIMSVLPFCHSVTSIGLSEKEMVEMNFPKEVIEVDGLFIKNNSKVKRILHNSTTFDFSALHQKFDVIFIDGDHHYEAVKSDTINAFKLLKDESSVIVWHDCGFNFSDQRNEVIAGILDGTAPEKRGDIYRVTNTLCAIYSAKPLPVFVNSNPWKPYKTYRVSITQESNLT